MRLFCINKFLPNLKVIYMRNGPEKWHFKLCCTLRLVLLLVVQKKIIATKTLAARTYLEAHGGGQEL